MVRKKIDEIAKMKNTKLETAIHCKRAHNSRWMEQFKHLNCFWWHYLSCSIRIWNDQRRTSEMLIFS